MSNTAELCARLLEHAAIHDRETSPYSPEQAQWAADLREAAAALAQPAAPVVERADSATPVVERSAGNVSDNAALAAPAVPPEWQPIETAPVYPFVKERWYVDGPRYLLSTGSSVFIGQYGYTERGKGRWQDHYGRICQPTHWMPLPAAPTAQQGASHEQP